MGRPDAWELVEQACHALLGMHRFRTLASYQAPAIALLHPSYLGMQVQPTC